MATSIKKFVKKAARTLTGSSSSSASPTPTTAATTSQHDALRNLLNNIDLNNDLPSIQKEMRQLFDGCSPDQSYNVNQLDTRMGRMLDAGSKILYSVEDTAEKIKSQAIVGEGNEDGMSQILSSVLETVGSAHYLGAALSLVAVAMRSYRVYSNNIVQCSDLLSSMVELLARLQQIWKDFPSSEKEQEQERFKEITWVIILGALKIHFMASKSKLSRFILALIDQQDLKNIQQKISLVYDSLNLLVSSLTFGNVNRAKYSNVVPSKKKTVGIEPNTEEVVNELGVGQQTGKTCVCLHAMGGAGKSTIADSAYCRLLEDQLKGYKHCRLELDLIEERSNIKKRQMELLEKLTEAKSPKIANHNDGRVIINSEIEKLRCPVFLLLDNVLRLEDVDYLVPHASNCRPGSVILTTTRNEAIRSRLESLEWKVKMMPIQLLQDEQARMLLYQSMVFPRQDVNEAVRNEYEKQLLAACGGLPLSLKLAGGHIKAGGPNQPCVWEFVLESLQKGNSMTGDANDIDLFRLKFSIDSLSSKLKEAFFDVISFYDGEKWSLDFESVVGKELQMLEERHLVQRKIEWLGLCLYDPIAQARTPNKTVVQVHDMLRGLGHKMMKEDDRSAINITNIHEFKSSMASSNKRCKINGIWLKSKGSDRFPEAEVANLPANLLCEMPDIRYLVNVKVEGECMQPLKSLKKCHLLSHNSRVPFALAKAESLKSLKVCNIDMVSWVQLPKNLRILSLTSDCIKNLRHFKDCNLEVLKLKYCHNLESSDGIANLRSLKHLKILYCEKLRKVDIEGCCLEGLRIISCGNLQKIQFYNNYSGLHDLHVTSYGNLAVLPQNLSHQQNLKHVSLKHCYMVLQFPDGFLNTCPNLTDLYLDRCSNLSQLPDGFLNACPNLTNLSLKGCSNLSQLPDGFLNACPSLKDLHLERCSNLSQLPDGFLNACPNFTSLSLYGCSNLSLLPNDFLNAWPNLTSLSLYGCWNLSQLPYGFLNDCPNLSYLSLEGCSNLSQLPDGFLNTCPNLADLCLVGCSNLSLLPNGFLNTCPNLTDLSLVGCSNLSNLPDGFLNVGPNLTYLSFEGCSNLCLSQLPDGFLDACPNLSYLYLEGCSNLSQFPYGFLNACPNLTSLSLKGCSNLSQLPDGFLNACPNLVSLSLIGCLNLSQLPDGFLNACPNLTSLSMKGCLNLSQLPDGFLNACPKLTSLALKGCLNLSQLPDGFLNACANFTSLSLYGCSNLSQLPDGFLNACPKLTNLSSYGCLNLSQLPDGFLNAIPNLKRLCLIESSNLSLLPDGFLNDCPNLTDLYMERCSNLSQLPDRLLRACPNLTSLSLYGCSNLSQFPDGFLNDCPNLASLSLVGCSNLSQLPNGFLNACPNLTSLSLYGCVNLSQLPDGFLNACPNPTSLSSYGCSNLSQLPDGFVNAYPNLKRLCLFESSNLSHLPDGFLNACPNLIDLYLERCQNLSQLPDGFLNACPNFTNLSMYGCSNLSQLPDGFLNTCPNLTSLSLSGCSNLSQLPDCFLNACPNLTNLSLLGCSNLFQLPDGFLNDCPNLKSLSLDGCSNLSQIPDGFLNNCPNLKSLSLDGCLNLSLALPQYRSHS